MWNARMVHSLKLLPLLACLSFCAAAETPRSIYDHENLMAWCIVPFDAKKRGPEERAVMLEKLGIHRFAYDYRAEHIPTFDAEVEAMNRHKIEFTAWWFPGELNDEARTIFKTIDKYKITPQLWIMGGGDMLQPGKANDARVVAEANRVKTIAVEAKKHGCKVGLYNHGAWFGEPENQIDIIQTLLKENIDNVGIVYNFHHGHEHLPRFGELVRKMKPYLLAVNLNGMIPKGDAQGKKILTLSQGTQEHEMMRVLEASGWHGAVGIIDHLPETDSEKTLGENLLGFKWLVAELRQPGSGGPRPFPELKANAPKSAEGHRGQALNAASGGLTFPGKPEYRQLPLVLDCWAKLHSSTAFNILVASDPKSSAQHWELYSFAGSGEFCVYQPGRGGNFNSGVKICDDKWHHVTAILEANRVRLFVDDKLAKEFPATPETGAASPGGFAIGQLVEGGVGCDGLIDEVRLHRGTEWDANQASLGEWSLDTLESPAAAPAAAAFFPDAPPLDPAEHPYHGHKVNRDRMYDFYAKEALKFAAQRPLPTLVPAYPGLDSGRYGHWGNQNEEVWNDSRWNTMDAGGMQSGIIQIGPTIMPRGVCVQLGDQRKLAACFDTDTLTWKGWWAGGKFLHFDSFRWGMLAALAPDGKAEPFAQPEHKGAFTYHGFYRHGGRVIFSYAQDGEEWLESAWEEGGKAVVKREKRGGTLDALTKGGPPQWPQILESKASLGQGQPYAVDAITPPTTPWNSLWHFGGHDFLPNGDAVVCTFEGEVWVVTGLDAKLDKLRWKRFASGLSQPLGLKVIDGKICVLGRDQITRLHDLNGDGEADFYEAYSRAYETPVGGHDYLTGLETDAEGRMYFASGKIGLTRISADGKSSEILATGFRNPNGIAVGPQGEVVAGAQEGDWTAASLIAEIKPGGHYRYSGPKPGPLGDLPPTMYFPRGVENSCGGDLFVNSDRWGIKVGELLHFSWGTGSTFLILREEIGGQKQGCAIPLPGEFSSGAHRGRFRPQDGQLYVTGITGWGTYTPDDGCFARVRYTGGEVVVPLAVHAHDNGVRLEFAQPLDAKSVTEGLHFAQQWNYLIGPAYGSDEYSVRWPGTPGHDVLEIRSAHLLDGGKTVFLEMPQLLPCHQLHLHCDVPALLSRDFFLTLHNLGPAFVDFPGYQAIAKIKPGEVSAGPGLKIDPSPWEKGTPGRALLIQAAAGLQFAQRELRAKAGEALSLTFENHDPIPHNWTLVKPGMSDKVAELADKMLTEPGAYSKSYVPDSPEILCYTRMVEAGTSSTIHFQAPASPGNYPYFCTFPGHTKVMRGVLIVE